MERLEDIIGSKVTLPLPLEILDIRSRTKGLLHLAQEGNGSDGWVLLVLIEAVHNLILELGGEGIEICGGVQEDDPHLAVCVADYLVVDVVAEGVSESS